MKPITLFFGLLLALGIFLFLLLSACTPITPEPDQVMRLYVVGYGQHVERGLIACSIDRAGNLRRCPGDGL